MDNNLDLLPSALFSPSKAAQQRAQAQDWHHVDTWLSSKYQGRTVPTFERNEETLKTLIALVAANEKADEERDLVWSIQKEALGELKSQQYSIHESPHSTSAIVNGLTKALPTEGSDNLDAMASLAGVIDAPNAQPETMAMTFISLTQTSQSLTEHLLRLTHLQRRLENEVISLRSQMQRMKDPAMQPPIALARQTVDWNRNTKVLKAKLGEYNDRLAALAADTALERGNGELVEKIAKREKNIEELRVNVESLEKQVDAFRGLPNDRDGARKEVERAVEELAALQSKRDGIFEGWVEKG